MTATKDLLLLRDDVVVTPLENEVVLLDLSTKHFYSLNASAWVIVQQFEAGAGRDDAILRCVGFGAAPEQIGGFIDRLLAEDLVRVSTETPGDEDADSDEVSWTGDWVAPTLKRHAEPLQKVMVSAFDPSLPLAE